MLPQEGLFLRDASIHKKASLATINKNFSGSDIKTLTDEQICEAIEKSETKVVGMFFPYSIAAGNIGPVSKARIQYVRCFIDLNSGKIYTAHGAKAAQFYDPYYRDSEFKKYSSCK